MKKIFIRHPVLSVLFIGLMALPIYFIIQMENMLGNQDWKGLKSATINYLICIWSSWIFMATIAIYSKWTEKNNFFFHLNYTYLIVVFVILAYYSNQLFKNLNVSDKVLSPNMLTLIWVLKNAVPILGATAYLQISVWWFERKWHRE